MSSFTDPLILKKLKGEMWETAREFTYYVGKEGSDEKITVPVGFQTDLASVPFPATIFIPKDGTYAQSAVLHDHLYRVQTYTRKRTDQIFYEAMGVLGVPFPKRQLMFLAVRVAGWLPWGRYFNVLRKKVEIVNP